MTSNVSLQRRRLFRLRCGALRAAAPRSAVCAPSENKRWRRPRRRSECRLPRGRRRRLHRTASGGGAAIGSRSRGTGRGLAELRVADRPEEREAGRSSCRPRSAQNQPSPIEIDELVDVVAGEVAGVDLGRRAVLGDLVEGRGVDVVVAAAAGLARVDVRPTRAGDRSARRSTRVERDLIVPVALLAWPRASRPRWRRRTFDVQAMPARRALELSFKRVDRDPRRAARPVGGTRPRAIAAAVELGGDHRAAVRERVLDGPGQAALSTRRLRRHRRRRRRRLCVLARRASPLSRPISASPIVVAAQVHCRRARRGPSSAPAPRAAHS